MNELNEVIIRGFPLLHIAPCVFHGVVIPTVILIINCWHFSVCVFIFKIILQFCHVLTMVNYVWICGHSWCFFYTRWMGLIPRQQCRKAPASVAEKGHILDLLIKPRRLPCFKSKALFRLQEGVLHRLWGFFSALKREAKMTNMSVIYSVGAAGDTGEMRLVI